MRPAAGDRLLQQFEKLESSRQAVFTGIYLTLFSVAGGVSLGLVATNLSQVVPEYGDPLGLAAQQWTALLLSLSTLFVLGTILSGYVLTASYFYWEPTWADVVSPLALGFTICMMAAYVDDPAMWIVWLFLVGMSGGMSYFRSEWVVRNDRMVTVEKLRQFEAFREQMEALKREQLVHLRRNKRVSFATGILGLGWGIARGWFAPPEYAATVGEVLTVTLLLLVACGFLAYRYSLAFSARSRQLGWTAERALRDRLKEARLDGADHDDTG